MNHFHDLKMLLFYILTFYPPELHKYDGANPPHIH
jgi:hypothetical protein